MTSRPRLTFVSPRFLFPCDSGGKIRTSQILRGLKGGAFEIELLMPSTHRERERFGDSINDLCDCFRTWQEPKRSTMHVGVRKAAFFLRSIPMPVASDYSKGGSEAVREALNRRPDVVVFDFPHSVVLAPENISVPSVLFTHNVEAQIFRRHLEVARSPLLRAIWRNQYGKMLKFERRTLRKFDRVVTVSERDAQYFSAEFELDTCRPIPTGVDTEFFDYQMPNNDNQVVFCGSMDWMANIDGVENFHDEVWPQIRDRAPGARMKVVGRTPPASLVQRIAEVSPDWEFTGFVDDVRDHVAGAAVFVIPLRVGGGTRIKAFEAMAMGTPVVSTSIGIEGLPVENGRHYLNADTAEEMASAVVELLENQTLRVGISEMARALVEARFGFRKAASVFEEICAEAARKTVSEQ